MFRWVQRALGTVCFHDRAEMTICYQGVKTIYNFKPGRDMTQFSQPYSGNRDYVLLICYDCHKKYDFDLPLDLSLKDAPMISQIMGCTLPF